MTLLELLSQHILEPQMLLVPQDMMELLPQHKYNVRLVGIGQLLQDVPSKVSVLFLLIIRKHNDEVQKSFSFFLSLYFSLHWFLGKFLSNFFKVLILLTLLQSFDYYN